MKDVQDIPQANPDPALAQMCKSRDYKITSKGGLSVVSSAEFSSRRALEQMRSPMNDLEKDVREYVRTAHAILKHAHQMLEREVTRANS